MRKMIRTMVFGVVIAAPLLLVPHQSKAGGILGGLGDFLKELLGDSKDKNPNAPGNGWAGTNPNKPTNSVPLDKGTVFLVVAGLGLGVKMIYDRRRHVVKSVI